MSRHATLAALSAVAVALTLGVAPQAEAGHGCGGWKPSPRPIVIHPPHPAPAPTVVNRPISYVPQPAVAPTVVPQRAWYFGMSLQITNTAYGRGLQVASVTPGSPASLAGLEPGDVLIAANGTSLQNAYSNEHGVQLLQSAVGQGAPAPTAATTFVVPSSPNMVLTVVNVRTNRTTHVSVQPRLTGAAPAPTYSSPVASSAPAVSAF